MSRSEHEGGGNAAPFSFGKSLAVNDQAQDERDAEAPLLQPVQTKQSPLGEGCFAAFGGSQ